MTMIFLFLRTIGGKAIMGNVARLTTILIFAAGLTGVAVPGTAVADSHGVTVTVKGESWDACSRGFAYYMKLSKKEREETSARRGSRVSVDGQADKFAITDPGFELTFTTTEPTFRLIVEGDRFPRVITQPIAVPGGGGVIDIDRVDAPRIEGPEHTWPLEKAAEALGYNTPVEMLANNNAAIRLLVYGSGEPGTPDFANNATIAVTNSDANSAASVSKPTNSPFLMRVPQDSYVFPFDMNPKDTFLEMTGPPSGAFIVIVPFAAGADFDKDVTIDVTDHETEKLFDPPRPWIYDPAIVSVRNGFATSTIRIYPGID
ncbi:MAG: hypothetical protein ACTSQ7_11535 [Alphaproteobacteria bacterium]